MTSGYWDRNAIMDFTIITPSLGYGRFLGDCLESTAWQKGVTLEHLVIDGGSTDDSAAVAARFSHAVWSQEPDLGMSDAINKGFERAKGDWVIWINADDFLMPGGLAEILPILKETTADIVYGDIRFVNADGNLIREVRSAPWSMFAHVHHACYVQSTAAFYRKSTVIEPGHRLREDFHYVMDGEFYARLASDGKIFRHVRRVIAAFRMHGENVSQRHLGRPGDMAAALAAERQHIESRAIRRIYGFTFFSDPYLNGLVDGCLWIAAGVWKKILKLREKLLP
jgi:glycosyltransferase involved in cell wall biosynthesis